MQEMLFTTIAVVLGLSEDVLEIDDHFSQDLTIDEQDAKVILEDVEDWFQVELGILPIDLMQMRIKDLLYVLEEA